MRTKQHWEECNFSPSSHAAQSLALQLKETAKHSGYDPRGIKVLNKQQVAERGLSAGSCVTWAEGPIGWAYFTDIISKIGVCYEAGNDYTILFYDI